MKSLFIAVFLLLSTGFLHAQNEVSIDLKKSNITWLGKKVTGSHTGTINLSEGNLKYENGRIAGGYFVIDMTTIKNTDMGGNMAGKLEGHLKSDDFFGVATFPTAKLEITEVGPGDGGLNITANLTIKETTAPVTFIAKLNETGATANITVDRTVYDVRYGSGKFFDGLGDKMIYDNFDLEVNLAF